MDIFCTRLKLLKENKKCTYQQIADHLKLKLRTVKYYTSGEIKPDYFGLLALADYFDVSLDYLVGRSDEPESHKMMKVGE